MILIRADANEQIGAGHIMRCLSIAHAFKKYGQEILFITADHKGDRLIHQAGFQSVCLNSNWSVMQDEGVEEIIRKYKPVLLLVDSYYVTEEYFNQLSGMVPIAYIDDLNAGKWNVDYLINYNIFSEVLDYSQYNREKTKLILSPHFAPLRQEFQHLPPRSTRNKVSDIFVSAGGADPERITEKLLQEICPVWPEVRFHFVVGALNPRLDNIKILAKDNVVLHINEQHMSELMMMCDIAVSAAGSTLYELCASGTPTITYTLADNQLAAAEQFEKQRMMLNAGDCRVAHDFIEQIAHCIEQMLGDKEMRSKMSQRMQKLVDGRGADRIAEILLIENR